MLWTDEDVRRLVGMMSLGMCVRAALAELGLGVGDMVRNLRRLSRPQVFVEEVTVSKFKCDDGSGHAEKGRWRLVNMRASQCRYAMGYEGEHLFCGEPKVSGKMEPWCQEHRDIVYIPMKPFRKVLRERELRAA